MSLFTIWREQSTGGLVLVAGDRPPTYGDMCLKRIDAKSWEEALKILFEYRDRQASNGVIA